MDIQTALTFMRDDDRWVNKLGVGVLLGIASFLILPAFMLVGYAIEVARRVRDGRKDVLPDWDFGQTLKDGFTVSIAMLVYALPVFVLLLLAALATGVFGVLGGEDVAAAVGTGSFLLVGCLVFLYALVLIAVGPAVYIQYIRHGTLSACLQFRDVLALTRAHLSDILIVVLVAFGVGVAISIVGTVVNIVPCLGQIASLLIALAAVPYVQMVMGHLYGQIAAKVDGAKLGSGW